MDDMKTQLRTLFVQALHLQIDPVEVKDTNLVTTLGIDSIGVLEILVRVENTFRITIDDTDMSPDLVDSLEALSAYITDRQADRQGPEAEA
jgi:acyl carrier protein